MDVYIQREYSIPLFNTVTIQQLGLKKFIKGSKREN